MWGRFIEKKSRSTRKFAVCLYTELKCSWQANLVGLYIFVYNSTSSLAILHDIYVYLDYKLRLLWHKISQVSPPRYKVLHMRVFSRA